MPAFSPITHDDLLTPDDVDSWLDAVRVERPRSRTTPDVLLADHGLDDGERRLAAHVTADIREAAASAMTSLEAAAGLVNSLAAKAPAPALGLDNSRLERRAETMVSAVTGGLAKVATESIELLGSGDSGKIRTCHAPGCVVYFVKTHPQREWCSIACQSSLRGAPLPS